MFYYFGSSAPDRLLERQRSDGTDYDTKLVTGTEVLGYDGCYDSGTHYCIVNMLGAMGSGTFAPTDILRRLSP